MKPAGKIFIFLSWLGFLVGCAGVYTTVSFEILEPATVNLPGYVKQVAILNRSPASSELFDKGDISGLNENQIRVIDTMITGAIFMGLNEVLREWDVPAYDNPIWISRRRKDTTGLNIPLAKRDVNEISEEYGSDAIISLEYYILDVDNIYEFSEAYLENIYYKVSMAVKWIVYLAGSPSPFNEYTTYDTLYFKFFSYGEFIEVPPSLELIKEISLKSGYSYGNYITPTWNRITRVLYKGKEDILKETVKLTNAGNWDKAYEIWKMLLDHNNSLLAAKAAYNMAVYHELEDDLVNALKLVQLSESLDSTEIAESLREELQTRILNKKQIIEQMTE